MANYNDILKEIEKAVKKINRSLPDTEKKLYNTILNEIKRLDTSSGKIKVSVKNMVIVDSIKRKLSRLILNKTYLNDVKEFAKSFNTITKLQNDYWRSVESRFKPTALLKAIRVQAISTTIDDLAGQGIGKLIGGEINQILRQNITTGGTYASLAKQLEELILESKTPGILQKNVNQVAIDSINQYNAQYTQAVSSDLGFEWYAYQGSEILTSRPFCQALTENHRYFHISGIPNLLKALDESGNKLQYIDNTKGKELKTVQIYEKTGLPHGFIEGTDASNFMIRRGGYQCGHQIRPVSENLVKFQDEELYNKIINSKTYKAYKKNNP